MAIDTVPNAMPSERFVLASSLISPVAMGQARRLISADDWFVPAHEEIWRVMLELAEVGAADFIAVNERLRASKSRALPALSSLIGADQWSGSLEYHCALIAQAHIARRLIQAVQRGLQKAQDGGEPVDIAEQTIGELRAVQLMGTPEATTESDFIDIISRVVDPATFVVPGLLAKGNRIIITAPEGYGKSSLLRQIAACTAAGVHPLHPKATIAPAKVLVVDAENPEDINTTEYQRVADALLTMERLPQRNWLTIDECGPLNLLDGREAALRYAQIERLQPKLIVIGPLYQLHEESPNEEGPARKLAAVLDRMVRISGAAIVIEAHTPHNDGPQGQMLRPFGASLWKRWPEFGYCLHPAVKPKDPDNPTQDELLSIRMRESKFTSWRGNRASRKWPARLSIGQHLPWEPTP